MLMDKQKQQKRDTGSAYVYGGELSSKVGPFRNLPIDRPAKRDDSQY